MHALVIGGTAFMGRNIVRRLCERGHEVSVLHRKDHHDLGRAVRNLRADRHDLDTVRRYLRDHAFDVVFDLAYDFERGTGADVVESTARACGKQLHRYVFMSSMAVYGAGFDRLEEDPLAPADHPMPYVAHKVGAERALFALHAEDGFPVAVLRPAFVYGPNQPFYREQFFWDRLLQGRPVVLPDGGGDLMQWAYAPDVAEACVRAVEVPEAAGQAFNIAHPEPVSQRQFVAALARTACVEPKLVSVSRDRSAAAGGSPFAGRLYFGEFLDVFPITQVVEKAIRVLGVKLTSFEDGLREAFAWYGSQPRRPVDYSFEDRLLAEQ